MSKKDMSNDSTEYAVRFYKMAMLKHEVWINVDESGESFPGCCLAGPDGDGFRNLLGSQSYLLTTFVSSCRAEAMNRYYEIVGYGECKSDFQSDFDPYPEDWASRQKGQEAT